MVTIKQRATKTIYDYFRDAPPPKGLVLHVQPVGYGIYYGWCVEGAKEKDWWWPWARHDWAATIPDFYARSVAVEVMKPEYLDAIKFWAEELEQSMGIEVQIVVLRNAYPFDIREK